VELGPIRKRLWPFFVALALVGMSSASDGNIFGRIEFKIRQFAHERAFIPEGTRMLARRLASDKFTTWMLPISKDVVAKVVEVSFQPELRSLDRSKKPVLAAAMDPNTAPLIGVYELADIMDEIGNLVKDISEQFHDIDNLFRKTALIYHLQGRIGRRSKGVWSRFETRSTNSNSFEYITRFAVSKSRTPRRDPSA
jgi:hypothetical protein